MLGISPSAYQDARDVVGPEKAAVAVACILERANFINSAVVICGTSQEEQRGVSFRLGRSSWRC